MKSRLQVEVSAVLGEFLSRNRFQLDEVGASDPGQLAVLYYRSDDCKLQIYSSPRDGEINCMLGDLDAPNEFGLRSRNTQWFFPTKLSGRPRGNVSTEERLRQPAEFASDVEMLEDIRDLLANHFEDARAALLQT